MNVVCGQCGTGYEFDDALVSDRGTTVRCTQCGFQFRVHSTRGPGNAPERWIVRKVNGEEYIFRSLSELQRAIAQRRVVINDSLSRDGATFRPLHQLSELDSFFTPQAQGAAVPAQSAPSAPEQPRAKRPGDLSQKSLGAAVEAPSVPWDPASTAVAGSGTGTQASNTNAFSENTPRGGFITNPPAGVLGGGTLMGPGPSVKGPPRPDVQSKAAPPIAAPAGGALPVVPAPHPPPVVSPAGRSPGLATPQGAVSNLLPNAPLPYAPTLESERVSSSPPSDERPTPTGALPRRRRSLRGSPEDNTLAAGVRIPSAPHLLESLTAPPRKRFGGPRWIVAVVLLGGSVLVAATVGRNYFASFRSPDATSGAGDPRIAEFVTAGDEAFAAGDLEEARAQFEKASALNENVDVLQRLLSVEVFRADGDWLQLKVIPTESTERPPVESDFRERCGKIQARVSQLQKAGSGAQSAGAQPSPGAPSSPGAHSSRTATLALIDALRVLGQVQTARSLVESSSGLGAEPQEAYVSAMLDLSEPNPNWDAVITRLKGAAAAERGVPRAQAALVYALIGSKNFAQAQQELEVLKARKRQHPATPVLERYLTESQQAAPRSSAVDAPETALGADTSARVTEGREGAGHGDPMAEAADARAAGELARAARLYSQALSQDPGNVAAMTGLGDVARSQGNADIALSHYGAALRANPNHAPAILACADLKWSLGDRAGAVELYRRLSDGPPRVHDRVLEFEKAAGKAGSGGGAPSGVAAPSSVPVDLPPPASSSLAPPAQSVAPKPNQLDDFLGEKRDAPPVVGPPPDIELK